MKKIPIYGKTDIKTAEKDGNFGVTVFADFISQLLQQEDELSLKEKRFIAPIDEEGTELLNDNQMGILKKIVSRYDKKCVACNEKIPLNEVFHLGKYCNNHYYLNDDEN